MKSWRCLAIVLVALLVCTGVLIWKITSTVTWKTAYAAGESNGKGQVLEAVAGEAYELHLYGVKDGRVYEVEGPFGYSVNGQPVIHRLPTDARRGDTVICVRPGEEIKIIPRM